MTKAPLAELWLVGNQPDRPDRRDCRADEPLNDEEAATIAELTTAIADALKIAKAPLTTLAVVPALAFGEGGRGDCVTRARVQPASDDRYIRVYAVGR